MKRNRIIILILCLSFVIGIAVFATGGSEGESLITLSYLKKVFVDVFDIKIQENRQQLNENVSGHARDVMNEYQASALTRIETILSEAVQRKVVEKIAAQPEQVIITRTEEVKLYKGDKVLGKPGAGIILQTGAGSICGPAAAEVLNVTTGSTRKAGFAIRDGVYYMVLAEDESGIVITSDNATALIKDGAYIIRSYEAQYTKYADMLKSLGLFLGTNNGYELERAPTRQEALIMLIRLLGEEQKALAFDEKNMTFTDVTGWIDGRKYIAYGAAMKYTNGRSAQVFDQSGISDVYMYLTYVLRALGYSDAAGDFVWNTTSAELAVNIGLLTQEQLDDIKTTGFKRDHVTLISINALFKVLKNENITLVDKLLENGMVTQEAVNEVIVAMLG